jgi:2-polyprenyl-3-methyl-5-hydroxy-6-metoxy-1,4-benzoquinol methylase
MAYNYDELYGKTPNALGEPTAIFVDFFDRFLLENARVLDVGCGQGRDALFIARRGHRVVGVDMSSNGIRDLQAAADMEGLAVESVLADLTKFTPDGAFDVILIDRTLHMLPKPAQLVVLARLLDHVDHQGWVLIADEASNIVGFADVISLNNKDWRTELSERGYLFVQRV